MKLSMRRAAILGDQAASSVRHGVSSLVWAAYNRSMFDKPVGHVIQQLAIEHMKKINLSWYRIGNKFFPKDGATDKEINISKFKEGFASKLIPRFELYMTDKND